MVLPDAIRQALERNAQQLSPITLTLTQYPPGYPGPSARTDDWPVPESVKEGEGPFVGMHTGQLLRILWQTGKFRTWRRLRSGRPESESIFESSVRRTRPLHPRTLVRRAIRDAPDPHG